jgi:hypothetical protein
MDDRVSILCYIFKYFLVLVVVVVVICSCRMIQSGQSWAQSHRLVAHWSDVN